MMEKKMENTVINRLYRGYTGIFIGPQTWFRGLFRRWLNQARVLSGNEDSYREPGIHKPYRAQAPRLTWESNAE